MEISLERSGRLSLSDDMPPRGLDDLGLEAFLHLLDPDLPLPQANVEPRMLMVRLRERGEKRDISLRIRNPGRGYLSGSIELADNIPGLRLASGRFGVDSRDRNGSQIQISIDGSLLEPGRHYISKLILSTNGEPERIEVFLSVQLVDRKTRAAEMIRLLAKYGTIPLLAYWLLLLHRISVFYGFHSPFSVMVDTSTLVQNLCIYLFLLATLSLPFMHLLSGRRPSRLIWLFWAASLVYTVYRLQIVVTSGAPQIASAFVTIYALATLVPAVIIALIRLIYYRLPHLHGSRALVIVIAATMLLWNGLYSKPPWLLSWQPKPVVAPPAQMVTDKIVLKAQDNNSAIYHLSGGDQKEIVITFTEKCWVRVKQDGELITERTYKPGEKVTLSDATETHIRLGFPPGAHIVVNGMALDDDIPGAPLNIIIVKE